MNFVMPKVKILLLSSVILLIVFVVFVLTHWNISLTYSSKYVKASDLFLYLHAQAKIEYFQKLIEETPSVCFEKIGGHPVNGPPVAVAAEFDRFDVVKLLLDNGASWQESLLLLEKNDMRREEGAPPKAPKLLELVKSEHGTEK